MRTFALGAGAFAIDVPYVPVLLRGGVVNLLRKLHRWWGEVLLALWAVACWVWLLSRLMERYPTGS